MPATEQDVLAGVLALWDGGPLPALVPGGRWHGRPAQDAVLPYAALTVEAGGERIERTGGYWQAFKLTAEVRSENRPETPPGPIAAALDAAFDWRHAALVVPNAGMAVWLRPLGPEAAAAFDDELHAGQDVTVTRRAWELMLAQG